MTFETVVPTRPCSARQNEVQTIRVLRRAICETTQPRTEYLLLELEASDHTNYAIAVGETDYRVRFFNDQTSAERVFETVSENEVMSYVLDEVLHDLGYGLS